MNGLPDQEESLHSPLPPPYSPLHSEENPSSLIFSFKLVGDNIDKDVKPRHMRLNHQTTSLHYFNTFAVQDRISTFNLPEQHTSHPSLSIHDFLPSNDDYTTLKSHFAILITRVLCDNMDYFQNFFCKSISHHIPHKYTAEMCKESKIVSCILYYCSLVCCACVNVTIIVLKYVTCFNCRGLFRGV